MLAAEPTVPRTICRSRTKAALAVLRLRLGGRAAHRTGQRPRDPALCHPELAAGIQKASRPVRTNGYGLRTDLGGGRAELALGAAAALGRSHKFYTSYEYAKGNKLIRLDVPPGLSLRLVAAHRNNGVVMTPVVAIPAALRSAVVGRFAVAGHVQSFAFLVFRYAQSAQFVGDLVGDPGHHGGPQDRQQHAFELHPHLSAIAPALFRPGPPSTLALNTPVSRAPTMPPTATGRRTHRG